MKIRLTFTSGMVPAVREHETDLEPVQFLEKEFGTAVAFGNMGGTFEVLEPSPVTAAEAPAEPAAEASAEPAAEAPAEPAAEASAEPAAEVAPETPAETVAEVAPELVPDAMIVPVEENADAQQEPEAA